MLLKLKTMRTQIPAPLVLLAVSFVWCFTGCGPIKIDWRNEATFTLALSLPDGMSAEHELPGNDATSDVSVDGKKQAATYQAGRWVVMDEETGSLQLEIR